MLFLTDGLTLVNLSLAELDVFAHLHSVKDHLSRHLEVPALDGEAMNSLHLAAAGEHLEQSRHVWIFSHV